MVSAVGQGPLRLSLRAGFSKALTGSDETLDNLDLPNPIIRSHYGHFRRRYGRSAAGRASRPVAEDDRAFIKPLLAAAQQHRRSRRPQDPSPLDIHYQTIRASMRGVFHELGIAA
jgi:hypothetical protein